MNNENVTYEGDGIAFAEMPYGMEIWNTGEENHESVVIASIKDAEAVVESLKRMIEVLKSKL